MATPSGPGPRPARGSGRTAAAPSPAGAAPSGPAGSMGLRMQRGGRRSQAKMNECSAVVIPRCGPTSPFKGHLSNKSNAAVDCSLPKSRLASIKLADQQRREKLKKKIARCGQKISVCETVSPSCPRDSGRLPPSSFGKSLLEAEDGVSPSAGQAQYLSSAPSPYGKDCLVHSSPVKCTRKCSRHAAGASYSSVCVSRAPGKHSALPRSHSIESFVSIDYSQRCQGNHPRATGGDLLEKHSECFTKSRKPFTPRTLISNAKPSLSEYRFYTPARRRKKNHRKRCVEAQTQTDMTSFPSADQVHVRKVTSEKQKIQSKAEDKRYALDEPERGVDGFQHSSLRETSWCPQKSSPKTTVDAEEEELLYLTFIEDVTNEILRLGLFSNRVLDQLFECYIEENKNRLDEGKMRQMLDVLKSDLGCSQDSNIELIRAAQEASGPRDLQECDTTGELKFASKGHKLRKATKNEEFLETIDLSLKKPNKCESMPRSKRSRETRGKKDFSEDTTEIMGAGTDSDFCGVEFEEHPDTSSTCEAAFFACDSDLEVNKELDELEENFQEALHISRNYS
ncbi:spermatogenesis-associated protein 7 isoform X3 [Passer domesticus]|uniref:spermatogenesis-associated protein 7 isoform X3 n=1 Tax=Passer domesticus TaxID=48849 RepID=UPI0030FEC9C5